MIVINKKNKYTITVYNNNTNNIQLQKIANINYQEWQK